MADISLEFSPPTDPNIVALRIYEAPTQLGTFVQIERTEDIGTYPEYISYYSSDDATSQTDWFAIAWEDAIGNVSPMSPPIMGGTNTLVGKIVDRVLQRDTSLNRAVVIQEAEAAVESFFGKDPYSVSEADDIPAGFQYRTVNGLVYMTLARSILADLVQGTSVQSATMGLVSFKSESGSQRKVDIQELVDLANKELGLGTSIVLDMERICKVYGGARWSSIYNFIDQEFRYVPWVPLQIEG